MNNIQKLAMFFTCILLYACTGDTMVKDPFKYGSIDETLPTQWQKLAGERIFFGHKSVGNNILDGIQEILKDHQGIRLNILKIEAPDEIRPGTLAHTAVGKNGDPLSKIDDFVETMNSGIGGKVDIAFFKFCFVDITSATDVNAVFTRYRDAMAGLKKAYPGTAFVHVTTPLMWREPAFPKGLIKRLLGKGGDADNIARHTYNELMRKEYLGREPLFDLARIETIRHDGTVESFESKGDSYPSLVPEYTDDGGHLSATGKNVMGEQLLVFLAGLK